jgi:hypothetical protein
MFEIKGVFAYIRFNLSSLGLDLLFDEGDKAVLIQISEHIHVVVKHKLVELETIGVFVENVSH